VLGQVMGFVAVTVGFAALGAYLGRDLSGATGLVLFAAIMGLNLAVARSSPHTHAHSSSPATRPDNAPAEPPEGVMLSGPRWAPLARCSTNCAC
jgi:hypothetical protein